MVKTKVSLLPAAFQLTNLKNFHPDGPNPEECASAISVHALQIRIMVCNKRVIHLWNPHANYQNILTTNLK